MERVSIGLHGGEQRRRLTRSHSLSRSGGRTLFRRRGVCVCGGRRKGACRTDNAVPASRLGSGAYTLWYHGHTSQVAASWKARDCFACVSTCRVCPRTQVAREPGGVSRALSDGTPPLPRGATTGRGRACDDAAVTAVAARCHLAAKAPAAANPIESERRSSATRPAGRGRQGAGVWA